MNILIRNWRHFQKYFQKWWENIDFVHFKILLFTETWALMPQTTSSRLGECFTHARVWEGGGGSRNRNFSVHDMEVFEIWFVLPFCHNTLSGQTDRGVPSITRPTSPKSYLKNIHTTWYFNYALKNFCFWQSLFIFYVMFQGNTCDILVGILQNTGIIEITSHRISSRCGWCHPNDIKNLRPHSRPS